MRLFRISPPWDDTRNNPYPWVDSADGLFGPDELHKSRPIADAWEPPRLFMSGVMVRVDAYCIPGGFFVFSPAAREALTPAFGSSAEWLPVELVGFDGFELLHPLHSYPLGPGAVCRRNEVSKNITSIDVYDFSAEAVSSAALFYAKQPADSAAGAAGYCFNALLASEASALIWQHSKMRGVRFQPIVMAEPGPKSKAGEGSA